MHTTLVLLLLSRCCCCCCRAAAAAAAGLTTNIINGGLECSSGTPKAQELDRIGYFKRYCDILGVTYGDNLDCAAQQHY
jgi:chitinase